MYGIVYKSLFLKKGGTLSLLRELEKNQWLPEERLKELQWQKLKRLLRHSYSNVPFYRKRFENSGISPDNIKKPEDFNKIPFLTRQDICDNLYSLVAENLGNKKIQVNKSGGSTGEPIKFFHTRQDCEWQKAGLMRTYRWAGYDYGKKITVIWGFPIIKNRLTYKIKSIFYDFAIRRQKINTFCLSNKTLERFVWQINRFMPEFIETCPAPLYEIARFISEKNLKAPRPRTIISCGETLSDYQRELIEKIFDCRVFDRYSCSEVMVIGAECDRHEGLHLNMDNLYVECLKGDKPALPGETGEIVLTDLNNITMPFIRYKIGDFGVLSAQRCACGRSLPLLEKVEGRVMDMLVTHEGDLVQPPISGISPGRFDWIRQYQIVQEEKGKISFSIIKNRDFLDEEGKSFLAYVNRQTNGKLDIGFEIVDNIPLAKSGKFKIVVSRFLARGANG